MTNSIAAIENSTLQILKKRSMVMAVDSPLEKSLNSLKAYSNKT